MQKAVLYCRVSTREQAETGHSLEAQQELLRQYATAKGFSIVETIAVPESASGARERLHFAQMLLSARKAGVKHILSEKVDRISRNFKEAIKLQDWIEEDTSHHIHFVKQSLVIGQNSKSSDTFMWDIFLSMARQYSRNLSEEVKKGHSIAAQKGFLPCAYKIGYLDACTHGGKANGQAKKPDPALVPVIQEIFQKIIAGVAVSEIWNDIRHGKLTNTRGNTITRARFYLFLRDPFVCGQFKFKGKLYEGKHKPIISKQIFYEVQDILDGRKNRKKRVYDYMFRNLAVDAKGQRLRCATSKGIAYYNRDGKYTPEWLIDEAVAQWFSHVSLTDKGIESIKQSARHYMESFHIQHKEARHAVDTQLTLLETRASKAQEKLLDGVMSDSEYRTIMTHIEEQRQQILRNMPAQQAMRMEDVEPMIEMLKTLKKLSKAYPRLDNETRSAFAKIFLLELKIIDGKVYIKAKKQIDQLLNTPKIDIGWLDWDSIREMWQEMPKIEL